MRNRSQWLSGFLAGRGYYYQIRLQERVFPDKQVVDIDFYGFDDLDHKNRVGGLRFGVPRGSKVGDIGSLLVIAETIVRKLNTTRIPHRPSVLPIAWGARIIQICRDILGVECKPSEDPIARIKEIANICGFFCVQGPDGPLDDTTPEYISAPMLHWQKLQEEGLEAEETASLPNPVPSQLVSSLREFFLRVLPWLSGVEGDDSQAKLFFGDSMCVWAIGKTAPEMHDDVRAAWIAMQDAYCLAHPDYAHVLEYAHDVCRTRDVPKEGAAAVLGMILAALDGYKDVITFDDGPAEAIEFALPADVADAARTALKWAPPPQTDAHPNTADELAEQAEINELPEVKAASEAFMSIRLELDEAERAGKSVAELDAIQARFSASMDTLATVQRTALQELRASKAAAVPTSPPTLTVIEGGAGEERCKGFVVDDATGATSGCAAGEGETENLDGCPTCNDSGVLPPAPESIDDPADSGWSENQNDGDESNGVGNVVGDELEHDNVESPL